jgi:hypothetical protein
MPIIKLFLSLWILLYSLNAFAQQDLISDSGITETDLSFIPLETVNLLEQSPEDTRFWRHKDPALLQDLLMTLPIEPKQFKELKSFLLKSPIFLERSTSSASTTLMNIRLYHLALAGELETIAQYVYNIPQHLRSETIERYSLLAQFVTNKIEQACLHIPEKLAEYKHNFWLQTLIYCQAYNKEKHQLDLSLKLLKEDQKNLDPKLDEILALLAKKEPAHKQANTLWIELLQEQLIPHHSYIKIFPKPPTIESAILSQSELDKHWPSEDEESKEEAIERMAGLYNLLYANGINIAFNRWNRLWLYALSEKVQPPSILVHHYLLSALKEQQLGVALVAVTYVLTSYSLADISYHLQSDILYTLRVLGLHKEAEMFSRELLKNKKS